MTLLGLSINGSVKPYHCEERHLPSIGLLCTHQWVVDEMQDCLQGITSLYVQTENEAQGGPERVAVCCRAEPETNNCVSWEEYTYSLGEEGKQFAVNVPTTDVE